MLAAMSLNSAASEGDAVVHTAFSVVVRSQDLDNLAALFKDIAANKRDAPKVTSLTRDIHAVSTSYVVQARGANPTLYARKKLSGLFEKFPKVQIEKKRGGFRPRMPSIKTT